MMRRTLLLALLSLPVAAAAQTDITGPQAELPKEKLTIVGKNGVRHEFNVEMALKDCGVPIKFGPVRATLELAAGTARRLGLHAGDKVEQRIFTRG